jgi:carbamoyltransferase
MCGFRAGIHEGKITGLAARGQPKYIDIFRQLIRYEDGQIKNISMAYKQAAVKKLKQLLPDNWEPADLASSVQMHLEEVAVPYIQHWVRKTGKRNVCLSGGVFANVILNQRVAELEEVDNMFVFPAMGDGGLAAGSAFSAWREANGGKSTTEKSFLPHVYLGSNFSDEEIEQTLKEKNVPYKRYDDIEKVIAHLIHEGKVVARFNGAMEYGPRALGNRTIMYHTREPEVNLWLNKRLNRTEFMPFAPACLAGQEEKLFKWNEASARAARFMTITMDCTEWMQENCPAVVHVDNTARPQIVEEETNPSFFKVIKYYYELSGIPVVVNTSFNMHEEPIVRSPADAVRAYQLGKLDNLAVGSYLLGDPPSGLAAK